MISKTKRFVLIPIIGLFISDMIIDYYSGYGYIFSSTFLWTYFSLLLVFIYSFYLNNQVSAKNVFINSFIGSLIFFITSNFGVWLTSSGFYPFSLSGLLSCYIAAIPFFKNTMLSTFLYSFALFIPYFAINKTLIFKSFYSEKI